MNRDEIRKQIFVEHCTIDCICICCSRIVITLDCCVNCCYISTYSRPSSSSPQGHSQTTLMYALIQHNLSTVAFLNTSVWVCPSHEKALPRKCLWRKWTIPRGEYNLNEDVQRQMSTSTCLIFLHLIMDGIFCSDKTNMLGVDIVINLSTIFPLGFFLESKIWVFFWKHLIL